MEEEFVIYTTYDSFEADRVMALFKSNGIPSFKGNMAQASIFQYFLEQILPRA